jgi:hypothetical protein
VKPDLAAVPMRRGGTWDEDVQNAGGRDRGKHGGHR